MLKISVVICGLICSSALFAVNSDDDDDQQEPAESPKQPLKRAHQMQIYIDENDQVCSNDDTPVEHIESLIADGIDIVCAFCSNRGLVAGLSEEEITKLIRSYVSYVKSINKESDISEELVRGRLIQNGFVVFNRIDGQEHRSDSHQGSSSYPTNIDSLATTRTNGGLGSEHQSGLSQQQNSGSSLNQPEASHTANSSNLPINRVVSFTLIPSAGASSTPN